MFEGNQERLGESSGRLTAIRRLEPARGLAIITDAGLCVR
jgi:hypothetical protein